MPLSHNPLATPLVLQHLSTGLTEIYHEHSCLAWTSLPMPELLTMTSCFVEPFLMSNPILPPDDRFGQRTELN